MNVNPNGFSFINISIKWTDPSKMQDYLEVFVILSYRLARGKAVVLVLHHIDHSEFTSDLISAAGHTMQGIMCYSFTVYLTCNVM